MNPSLPISAPLRRGHRTPSRLGALALAGLLAACGGGDESSVPPESRAAALSGPVLVAAAANTAAMPDTARGQLLGAQARGTVTVQQVLQAAADARVPAIVPVYDVDTYRLTYITLDARLQPIVASGLLAVPRKGAGARFPVISIQHPTIFQDARAPSNNPTGTEPAVALASMGYLVAAADYVGYGASRGAPHPYLMAAPMAAAVVDLLLAGREHVRQLGVAPNGQLFLVGYSQGAHATLAAQRELQARNDEFHAIVVGSAPGGGPLDVGSTLDELLRRVRDEVPFLAALVNPDLLQYLGSSLRRRVRDEMLRRVMPEDSDVVFDGRFLDLFLDNDRRAINREADVHDWRPDRPVRLFHGRQDGTVPFVASAHALQAMQGRGAPDVQMRECPTQPSGHLDCVPAYWDYMLSQMAGVARDL
jgi:pimeloyl-ACP methyl ester carboxylesterase